MKIFIVMLESNIDGSVYFDAIPCATKELAIKVLQKEKKWVLKESVHFSLFSEEELGEYCELIDEDTHFCITDLYDDYYEDYRIKETSLKEGEEYESDLEV